MAVYYNVLMYYRAEIMACTDNVLQNRQKYKLKLFQEQ